MLPYSGSRLRVTHSRHIRRSELVTSTGPITYIHFRSEGEHWRIPSLSPSPGTESQNPGQDDGVQTSTRCLCGVTIAKVCYVVEFWLVACGDPCTTAGLTGRVPYCADGWAGSSDIGSERGATSRGCGQRSNPKIFDALRELSLARYSVLGGCVELADGHQ